MGPNKDLIAIVVSETYNTVIVSQKKDACTRCKTT